MNLTKFEPLKPSHSGDISLLVFRISKEAVRQPCLDKKIQCFSQNSYTSCVYFDRAFSYIPKCYFKIIKSGTKIGGYVPLNKLTPEQMIFFILS